MVDISNYVDLLRCCLLVMLGYSNHVDPGLIKPWSINAVHLALPRLIY